MRGKVHAFACFFPLCRITPAYAGKSRYRGIDTTENRDHPRLCGEKIRLMYEGLAPIGSPPPMRGKDFVNVGIICNWGITPAYAGKSVSFPRCPESDKDHPRLCGEKNPSRLLELRHMGSPPPMRGKANDTVNPPERIRITPAYAGKRKLLHLRSCCDRDHPRLCGEKTIWTQTSQPDIGSPPPMRGKVLIVRL